jgi:hypothetical protein
MNRLPATGTNELLPLLDPYLPDDFINEQWGVRPVRGPRWQFSAAQRWRVHLLALLTPVPSLNLLCPRLSEQRAWRSFARLRHRPEVPDPRILNAFRALVGVLGLRQINEALVQPLIQIAALWENATARIAATDLPAACRGFPKKIRARTPPPRQPSVGGPSRPARAAGLSATKNTASVCGGVRTSRRFCWCRGSVG